MSSTFLPNGRIICSLDFRRKDFSHQKTVNLTFPNHKQLVVKNPPANEGDIEIALPSLGYVAHQALLSTGSQSVGQDWSDWTHTQFSLVQLLSRVWLFATSWTIARQASLSITNSQSLLKFMSIESVMPSSHLILCCPLLPPSIFPASGSFPRCQFFTSGGQSIGVSASTHSHSFSTHSHNHKQRSEMGRMYLWYDNTYVYDLCPCFLK